MKKTHHARDRTEPSKRKEELQQIFVRIRQDPEAMRQAKELVASAQR